MHLLAAVVDTSAASIPYITLLQLLRSHGIDSCIYITKENSHYIRQFDVPHIIDDFDLKSYIYGSQAVESGTNGLRMFLSTRRIMSAYVPSIMTKIQEVVDSGQINPAETRFLGNGMSLVYLGHFLLELGFREFICVEPYRLIDWLDSWDKDTSQFIPSFLPQGFAARTIMSSQHGHTLAEKQLNRAVSYTFDHIKASIIAHIHTYSPQLASDKEIALGYPYPVTNHQTVNAEISDFIAHEKSQDRPIVVFTIGSMNLSDSKKRNLINEFLRGVQEVGASAIILGFEYFEADHCLTVNEFVPYSALFQQVDLVATHGGSGTTHMALWAGVPVLSVPFIPDQYEWARRLSDLGMSVGIISQESFDARSFVKAMRNNYTPQVVENARRWGEVERTAYSDSRWSVEALLRTVQSPITR